MSVAVVATAALSALGDARALVALAGEPARVAIAHDASFAQHGIARPFVARVDARSAPPTDPSVPDRATRLLASALRDLAASLDARVPAWRRRRLGLALGTSSGGMCSLEDLFRARAAGEPVDAPLARRATYFAPVADALAASGLADLELALRAHVLTACAASTFAIGLGTRWLERDAVDLVVVGGYDALTLLVAAGFEAIRATTASLPSPFRLGRDGMALGEGAGLLALVRDDDPAAGGAAFHVHGFGAATDAVHITAPDRSGDGLARAATAALIDAGAAVAQVAFVSAHATATPFNDAMEARAIERVLPGLDPPVQPLKAQIGHTLGAAGVLETIAAAGSLVLGLTPPAAGKGEGDPDAAVRLLATAEPVTCPAQGDPLVLKLSAAFGGANAALVLGASPAPVRHARVLRRVTLGAVGRVAGAEEARIALEAAGIPLERRAKLDSLSLLACGAVASLVAGGAAIRDGGVVVGHALGTLDVDERFFSRVLARGGAHGEPRLFPATSPNVCAGHAAILFGLRGPSAAVSGGLDGGVEALALGAELVAAGDASGVVVVAVDEVGPASAAVLAGAFPAHAVPPSGALAVWLSAGEGGVEVPLGIPAEHAGPWVGHVSLAKRLDRIAAAQGASGAVGSR